MQKHNIILHQEAVLRFSTFKSNSNFKQS